jgi:hypothetical protein
MVILRLRRSCEQVARDLESQALRRRHCQVQIRGRGGRRDNVAEGPANKSRQSRRGIFLAGRVVSFCGRQGSGRGIVELTEA